MKSSRVFRSLATAAATVALLAAPTGAAHAVYPPGGPGTIESSKSGCSYSNEGELVASVVITFTYEVTVPEATLTVRESNLVLHSETVQMGPGEYSFSLEGLAVFVPHSAELFADGQVVSTTEIGCPIPSVTEPGDDAGTGANSGAKTKQAAAATAATNATPVTGSASWPVAAGALTLLIAGVAMVVATRRRPLAN